MQQSAPNATAMSIMHLTKLVDSTTTLHAHGDDPIITAITQDSRQVSEGTLFAAIQGSAANGEDYIEQATGKGAAAILCRTEIAEQIQDIPVIAADNPRQALSQLAARFHQPQPEHIVAITGTDGKTSTAEFVRQFWELSGHPAMSVGTLGLKAERALKDMPPLSDNTTPEPVTFYQAIANAAKQGIHHLVCEASSHGLEQHRLDGLAANAAIFTSFSQDHLDYHATMEEYFDAKARLFHDLLKADGAAILCSDYPEITALATRLPYAITYGKQGDVSINSITPKADGQQVTLSYQGEHHIFHTNIFGEFQVYNIIAAMLAVSESCDIAFHELLTHCNQLKPIKGRLELVGTTPKGALIFIDYAHTAGALGKALETLRPYAKGSLHLVFGCGGDRDTAKRAQMGAVASEQADFSIVTDDNPRTEAPAPIRAAIMEACPDALEIGDRREAIHTAIRSLKSGDVLLIAGKGHEDYQIIGTTKHHFDDAEVARASLE